MKILVAGFVPFGRLDINPSADIAKLTCETIEHCRSLVLPTSYRRSTETIDAVLHEHATSAVLLLGYARTAHGLRLEQAARNAVTAKKADNDGKVLRGPIELGGPDELATRLDLTKCAKVVADAGCDVTIADRAGGYVCNYAYYHLLRHHPDVAAIFAHLSAVPGSEEFENVVNGTKALIEALLQNLDGHTSLTRRA